MMGTSSLQCYKAWLIAHGFQQEHGRDFDETFAPATRMTTIQTLLAVALLVVHLSVRCEECLSQW